jgi:hypothetical protein
VFDEAQQQHKRKEKPFPYKKNSTYYGTVTNLGIQQPELSLSTLNMIVKSHHVNEENVCSSKYIAYSMQKCP